MTQCSLIHSCHGVATVVRVWGLTRLSGQLINHQVVTNHYLLSVVLFPVVTVYSSEGLGTDYAQCTPHQSSGGKKSLFTQCSLVPSCHGVQ